MSALSEIDSKRACAFPMICNAISVVASFCSALRNCAFSRAFSACTALGRPTASPGLFPSNRPASRCLRHSEINDEYNPWRRRNAPP